MHVLSLPMASYQIPFIVESDKAVVPYQIRTLFQWEISGKNSSASPESFSASG